MATTAIVAHVLVDFAGSEGDTPSVTVEIDGREDGLNGGKTTFNPGEDAYLLVYVPLGWEISGTYTSSGNLSTAHRQDVAVEDFLVFVDDDSTSLSRPKDSTPTFAWIGTSLGSVSCTADGVCTIPPRTKNALGVPTPAHRVGVVSASYITKPFAYKLSGVPLAVSKVAVAFAVTKSATP